MSPIKIFKNQGELLKTIIVNLIVNECQFEGDLLFGLEERHVAGNPKQKTLGRVTAFFSRGRLIHPCMRDFCVII